MMQTRPIRRFTGWHMTGLLVAFFLVVIAVNIVMATIAVRSFGGTVVDNSYVESQRFNRYLAQARAQEGLGWRDWVGLDDARHVTLSLTDGAGEVIARARVTAVAQHPLGRAPDLSLAFREIAPGRYASEQALPVGRWQLRLVVRHGGGAQHLLRDVR
jgi:nitrogen fixation protein FixH